MPKPVCDECNVNPSTKKIKLPVTGRRNNDRGKLLKTKTIRICDKCLKEKYPDFIHQSSTVMIRGREVNYD